MKSAFCDAWGALCATLESEGVPFGYSFDVHDPLIHRGRDHLAHMFLKSAHSHLFFIDCDIMFNAADVLTLLRSSHNVSGAAYRRKQEKGGFNVSFLREQKQLGEVDVLEGGWLKVKELATGFMCISRAALYKMAYAHPELLRVSDHPRCYREPYYSFFHCHHEPKTRRELSEDYAFCDRWRALGRDVWCYGPARFAHVGTKAYVGSLVGDALERRAEVQA